MSIDTDPTIRALRISEAKGESLGPARQLCRACPCLQPCLTYALHYNLVGVEAWTEQHDHALLHR